MTTPADIQSLLKRVSSVREARMWAAVIIEAIAERAPEEGSALLSRLIERGGLGDDSVGNALFGLAVALEGQPGIDYDTRRELYSAARSAGHSEVAYILLELDRSEWDEPSEVKKKIQVEEEPQPIAPGGMPYSLGHRKSAARSREQRQRSFLCHDPSEQVIEVLLDNPSLLEVELLTIASRRPCSHNLLRRIALHRRWSRSARARQAVCLNPSAPAPLVCRLALDLRDSDLRALSTNAGSPALVRGHAERLILRREEYRNAPPPPPLQFN